MNEYALGCPCRFRPPGTDDLASWAAWYDHLAEMHHVPTPAEELEAVFPEIRDAMAEAGRKADPPRDELT